jgi:hypothetical protein
MFLKRICEKPGSIDPKELKDGQIATITSFYEGYKGITGTLVQRYGDGLIILGKGQDRGWPTFYGKYQGMNKVRFKVTPLQIGDILEVVEDI